MRLAPFSWGIFGLLLSASPAFSDELPPGLQHRDAATTGREDVAVSGFVAPEKPADDKDAIELKLSAGGLFSGGNSESLALTSSGKLRVRRDANQLAVALAANYGEAAPAGEDERETSVENYQGRLRYDRFLVDRFSVFLSLSALRDRFQGLDLRFNLDPGLAYYFVDAEKHRFWSELGYDMQYDYRREDAIEAAASSTGVFLDRSEVRHGARAFLGYENSLAENVSFDTSVEYLQALEETENWRLAWDVGLTAAIDAGFSIATTFSLRYDNNPLPEIETTDMTSAVSLVYQLL